MQAGAATCTCARSDFSAGRLPRPERPCVAIAIAAAAAAAAALNLNLTLTLTLTLTITIITVNRCTVARRRPTSPEIDRNYASGFLAIVCIVPVVDSLSWS